MACLISRSINKNIALHALAGLKITYLFVAKCFVLIKAVMLKTWDPDVSKIFRGNVPNSFTSIF